MTTVKQVQERLIALGYDIGGADGLIGPKTLGAALDALNHVPLTAPIKQPTPPVGELIPASWLPWAGMQRIVFHWTAGNNTASADDKKHYHLLIEGDGKLVRGVPSIDLNDAPLKKGYAAHTLNLNSDSIGVSLCGMAGAVESPFNAGRAPITQKQWDVLADVLAQLCRRYSIPVTRKTVLSHAEVQPTLGVTQRGKWDIARLPFDPSIKGAVAIGDKLRAAVAAKL